MFRQDCLNIHGMSRGRPRCVPHGATCPVVSPSGTNHFSSDTDAGPFFSCLATGVSSLDGFYRDILVTQGGGIVDSKYDGDKEITTAFRLTSGGEGDVVYANGSGGAPIFVGGDWGAVIANACTCDVGSDGPPASCTIRLGSLGTNPTDTNCLNAPVVGQIWNVTVSTTPTVGTTTLSTFATFGLGGPITGFAIFGYELLILPPFKQTQAFGTHNIPIPALADFIGAPFYLQGARIEANPTVVVLTNALDLVPGL